MNRRNFLEMIGLALAVEPLERLHRVYSFPSKITIVKSLTYDDIVDLTNAQTEALLDQYYGDMEAADFARRYHLMRYSIPISTPAAWTKIFAGMVAADRRNQELKLAKEIWTYGYHNQPSG
jgi:hypothetical protein